MMRSPVSYMDGFGFCSVSVFFRFFPVLILSQNVRSGYIATSILAAPIAEKRM